MIRSSDTRTPNNAEPQFLWPHPIVGDQHTCGDEREREDDGDSFTSATTLVATATGRCGSDKRPPELPNQNYVSMTCVPPAALSCQPCFVGLELIVNAMAMAATNHSNPPTHGIRLSSM